MSCIHTTVVFVLWQCEVISGACVSLYWIISLYWFWAVFCSLWIPELLSSKALQHLFQNDTAITSVVKVAILLESSNVLSDRTLSHSCAALTVAHPIDSVQCFWFVVLTEMELIKIQNLYFELIDFFLFVWRKGFRYKQNMYIFFPKLSYSVSCKYLRPR